MKTILEILDQFPAVTQAFYGHGGVDEKKQKTRKEEFTAEEFDKQREVIDGFLRLHFIKVQTQVNPEHKDKIIKGIFEPITGSLSQGIIVDKKEYDQGDKKEYDQGDKKVFVPVVQQKRHIHFDLVHKTRKESYLYWLEFGLNVLENKIKLSN